MSRPRTAWPRARPANALKARRKVQHAEWRRLGDLNPGWARTQTALAVRRHRPD